MTTVDGAAAFLRGRWRVERGIVDHRAGVSGEFLGTAVFGADLGYHEEGELRFGGHRGPASRSLKYVDLGGWVLDVTFADGRDFYRLDLSDGGWTAEHPCRADRYVVDGRITGPDGFTEHWHATGPEKDYELTTRYSRLLPAPKLSELRLES
ncbi:DUF6314 family protein [Actinoplanes sp. NPDC051851]|uniref:DUF6314 family protein n=1 Tax=Actinoplanes sp. NPDC051851 TaxID=3154753 RepID=UPI00344325AF